MTIVGENDIDIMVDANGQPVPDSNGDFDLVSDDDCWKQDLRLEAHTEEGELFYEDEDGDEAYGFGISDFIHAEDDEAGLTRMEISQRVKGKLAKRSYLDQGKTSLSMQFNHGEVNLDVNVAKNDENDSYNIELSTNEVEVEDE